MTQLTGAGLRGNLKQLVHSWWGSTADRWLLDFLESRDLLDWTKRVIAAGGALLAVVAALAMCSPAGPQHTVGRLLCGVIALGALGWALRWWLLPWPTLRASAWLAALADCAITLGCWLDSDRLAGLTGTTAFVLTGIYVTCLHGPKAQAAHVAWAVLTIGTLTAAMGMAGGPTGWSLAAAKALLALMVIVGILPVLQLGFWLMRHDATDSLIDPLTGVANRRGFDRRLDRASFYAGKSSVCVMVIDLDNFKTVNDRYGHHTGDLVLKRTAAHIRNTMGPGALIARVGGEEFVVIDLLDAPTVPHVAEHLREAIADRAEPSVTASVGVAVAAAHRQPDKGEITTMIACADAAMYHAKRQGGNTIAIHPSSTADAQERRPPRWSRALPGVHDVLGGLQTQLDQ
ncbi:hypothetical protein MFM001_10930 [Mycobacterium sp. MFM001]|uniref:sensor domain-containing diguanylate cyclase n=1 Tax=Mycobacterium sp. MFM001 TaxID=2049453 RepID=UPI000DA46061|nr:sensor domain-containing diguanylate cyclase [Mycobacterium sp. MFM001]GBE64631.1 hypothetical protein MFM001_10930 [Mycobacterium sp. MFM001]